jgi:tetratricopeptide (TPR) repeat protein
MLRVRKIPLRRPLLTAALLAATAVHAAQLRTSAHGDFQRISLDFGQPVRMQVAQGGGKVTLQFNQPLKTDAGVIARQLSSAVKAAVISPDGKSIDLTLAKPYRVRQFISGNVVGIDILTQSAPAEAAQEKAKPEAQDLASIVPKPEPKPAPKPAKKPTAKPKPVAPPAPDILSTKPQAAAPVEAVETNTQAEAAAAPVTDPILTTKPVEVPAAESAKDIIPSEPRPAPGEAVLTTKHPENEPMPVLEPPTDATPPAKTQPATIEPEQAAAETPLPAPDPNKPFTVSAKTDASGTTINFPWGIRTAAAVFERARDIWIVFSHEADAKPKLLATSLPKPVVRVQQYRLPGATILRLTTDGSLHATAAQPKGGYEWQVALGTQIPKPGLDIPASGELQNGNRYLLLGVFDISEPLKFFDPELDDSLIIVPAYEASRGVNSLKQYPEMTVLPTQQGAVIAAQRDDLIADRTRQGIRITGRQGALAVSDDLPIYSANSAPVPGASAAADVLMPYDRWYVAPDDFNHERDVRMRAIASATPTALPASELRMAELYLGQGMAAEALGYLELIKSKYPNFYTQQKLGVASAASNIMLNRVPEASEALSGKELDAVPEALMWRDLTSILIPRTSTAVQKLQEDAAAESAAQEAAAAQTIEGADPAAAPPPPPPPPKPTTFNFVEYNKPYIRFYPPRIRQKLAVIAADLYLASNQPDEALKVYDTLSRDGILGNVQGQAEFTLGTVAATKGKITEALAIFDRLSGQYADLYVQARASYAATMLRYVKGMQTADKTVADLESLRTSWRGDKLQREVLTSLAQIYQDNERYDDTLRTWKYLLDTFPNDPEVLQISGDMAEMFENLFLNGLADRMPPLKSLALFYEFRELTPIGARGDEIIQKLADRLASVDLLDRATQLLEHQIKFRISGEDRARVGARLALLYLLNHQPNEALGVIEITNYGAANPELRRQRTQLTAQALSDTGKHEEALSILFNDDSKEASLLKLDILWAMKDWPNVINQAEDILSTRANLTATLTPRETEVLMKLALGYTFEGDNTQLKYLRDYYTGLVPDSRYKEIFMFLTNDTSPLDPEDFQLVAKQISNTESFLDTFRTKIANGQLSETVK